MIPLGNARKRENPTQRKLNMGLTAEARQAIQELIDERLLRNHGSPVPYSIEIEEKENKWLQLHDIELDREPKFKNFRDFVSAVIRKDALVEQDPSAGGYIVPSEIAALFMHEVLETSIVYPRARIYPMKTMKLMVPGVEVVDHNDSNYPTLGGITMRWTSTSSTNEDYPWSPEAVELDDTTPRFRMMELEAKKLACYTKVSSEFMADSREPVNRLLDDMFTIAMKNYMDYMFIRGDGASAPLGVLNADCLYEQTRQAASLIDWTDVINCVQHLHPALWGEAIWLASPSTIGELYTLVSTAGSQVEGISLWPTLSASQPLTQLLGIPLIFSEKVPSLGNTGDLMLCAFSQYGVGIRQDVTFDVTRYEEFRRDMWSFKAIARVDGQPLWPSTMTLKDGTEVSAFVALK